MSETSSRSSPSVLRSAGLMGIATFLSRILGLVREQVIAILFGAGNATDAYVIAFRIPNLLRDLFAEGAMSASLVPVFTRARTEEGDRRAWRVAGLVFRVLFVVVSLIALIGIFFAPQLVELYAASYKNIPGKFELTVRLTRIMFPFFPLVALAAAFMGILNACGVFFMPGLASALFNLSSIVVGGGLAAYYFHSIEGIAVGVLVGGWVQALCQLPSLYRVGYRWTAAQSSDPSWHQDPALRRMLAMMIPSTMGLAATQINILINSVLATSQGSGAVSWLSFAFRLMQFPIGIFGVSLASATLPRVSQHWVNRDVEALSATLSQSLRHVFAINLAASAGLAFLGYPIVELIFQHGRFYAEDTQATATALAMYSIGLTAYSAVKVLVPVFYAMGNTRIPVVSSILAVVLTLVLNLIMVGPFGFWGLALGTSLAAILNAGFLLRAIQGKIEDSGGKFELLPIFQSFMGYLAVALVMGVACKFSHQGLSWVLPSDYAWGETLGSTGMILSRLVKVSLVIAEGALLTVFLARLLGLRDLVEAFDLFAEKLKKKLRRRPT